jgi:small subunit ribosomal protein S16
MNHRWHRGGNFVDLAICRTMHWPFGPSTLKIMRRAVACLRVSSIRVIVNLQQQTVCFHTLRPRPPIPDILKRWEWCACALPWLPLENPTYGRSRIGKEELPVLMIRLARFGARKQPYYRVVVIEKDRARNGRSVEVVGTYNPRTSPASVELKRERIDYWTSKGAQLSDTVQKLLKTTAAA